MNTFHFAQSETNERYNKDFINVDDDQLIYWYIILAAYIIKKNKAVECRRIYYANCALVKCDGSESENTKIVLAILRTRCVDPNYLLLVWWPDTNRTELWNTEQVHKNYISDYTQPVDLAKCVEARSLFFKQQKWCIRSDLAIPLSSGVNLGNPEKMKKLNVHTCKEIFDAYAVHQGKRVAGINPKILGPKFHIIYSGLVETPASTFTNDANNRTNSRVLALKEKQLESREAAVDAAEKKIKDLKRELELARKNEIRNAKIQKDMQQKEAKKQKLDKQHAPVVVPIPVEPTVAAKRAIVPVYPPSEALTLNNAGQMVFNPDNPSVWFSEVARSALNHAQKETTEMRKAKETEKARDQLTNLAVTLPESIAANTATAALFVDAFKNFTAK